MPYIGYGVENSTFDLSEQVIVASGNATEALSREVNEVTELLIFVNGTLLLTNEYFVTGTPASTLNFVSPPSAGATILVRYLQKSVDVVAVGVTRFENRTGSITLQSSDMLNKVDTASLQDDSVTSPKLAITYANETEATSAGLGTGDIYFDLSINSFRYRNSVGWLNAVGSDVNGNVNLSGSLSLLDNKLINLGTGPDTILQHYDNGSGTTYTEIQSRINDFYIAQSATGSVKISKWVNGVTNDLSELMATFNPDGAVELYFDNVKKLETSSTGITVVGDVNFDDGTPFTTTFQTITPTADRVINVPDASGTLGLIDSTGTLAAGTFDGNLKTSASAPVNNYEINFEYVSDTSINIRMKGSDGVVRSVNLTLA